MLLDAALAVGAHDDVERLDHLRAARLEADSHERRRAIVDGFGRALGVIVLVAAGGAGLRGVGAVGRVGGRRSNEGLGGDDKVGVLRRVARDVVERADIEVLELGELAGEVDAEGEDVAFGEAAAIESVAIDPDGE